MQQRRPPCLWRQARTDARAAVRGRHVASDGSGSLRAASSEFSFDELCHRLHVHPDRCVLIGDNLESDIAGAKGVKMKTILTLTGVATREDAQRLPPGARPDWVIDDLLGLI